MRERADRGSSVQYPDEMTLLQRVWGLWYESGEGAWASHMTHRTCEAGKRNYCIDISYGPIAGAGTARGCDSRLALGARAIYPVPMT
jgi:hypothetical protein